MANEQEEIIKKKAQFYYSLNIPCHIKIKPTGFRNGLFVSEFFDEGQYWMFKDLREEYHPERLFLFQVFDIKDYEHPLEEKA